MVCSHLGPRKKKRRGLTWDFYTSGKESVNEMWQLLYPVRNRLTSHRLLQHVRDCPCTAGHHSTFHSWTSLHCFLTFFFFLLFFVLFCFLLKPILLLEQTWDTRTVSETYGHPKDWPTPSICPTTPSVGASSVGRLQLIYRESPIQPYRKKLTGRLFFLGCSWTSGIFLHCLSAFPQNSPCSRRTQHPTKSPEKCWHVQVVQHQ